MLGAASILIWRTTIELNLPTFKKVFDSLKPITGVDHNGKLIVKNYDWHVLIVMMTRLHIGV